MSEKDVLLQLKGIGKSFSGVSVLENIDLTLRKGQVLGLVGENGAGKSTLMNVLGGVHKPDAGRILIEGNEVKHRSPLEATAKGIAFVHQELNLFNNLTVAENIYITNYPRNIVGSLSYKKINEMASAALDELDKDIDVKKVVDDLPMGQRQLVEVGKAIEYNAKIIIFDEPTTSLSNKEKEKLFAVIRRLTAKGVGVIYISHILEDIFLLCDDIMVLRDGQFIGLRKKEDVSKTELIEMMVGRSINQLYPYIEKDVGKEVLRVNNLSQDSRVNNVSFSLNQGEIVGLFGLMGAGRSEMARSVFGIDPITGGEIYVYGELIKNVLTKTMIDKGIAFITENRREEGLLMPKSVSDNLSLAYLKTIKKRFSYIPVRQENKDTDEMIKKIRIKTFNKFRQDVRKLSGGNQQKVVIGKWMLTRPNIFILDEPTRGIDVGAKFEIYTHINELAKQKSAVLFISSEMEELMGVCDRILVMSRGSLISEFKRDDFSSKSLMETAIGGTGS